MEANKRSSKKNQKITSLRKAEETLNRPTINNRNAVVGVLVVVTLIALGGALYFYSQFNTLRSDPQRLAQKETEALVTKVGKLIVLPDNEVPTVATVTDPNLLKDQPFFANAKTGDKVLIYTNARKAILYDPEADKIIEVAPVNLGPTQAPSVTSLPATSTVGGQPQ